ncbi:MAG TPA: TonB-dependent receptor [Caulobacteraceae bacterium]|nr:TonB-dependent receptor [Caulobacteraceae bacterium]
MRLRQQFLTTTVLALGGLAFAGAALADTPAAASDGSAQLSEVIVTAQKREERVQDVPLAITAFNALTLRNASVTKLTDLDGKIPNVTLEEVQTFPNASAFAVRGLGFGDVESTFEPTVGVEVNGVYLARNVGATLDLFDISSIEVRRGPQGTLDGGNTIGGVVAINTKKPTGALDGEVELTGGDHGRLEVRAAIDAPIVKDVLAVRLSVLDLNYDGYLHNLADGKTLGGINSLSERLTLAYTPPGPFDATVVVDHDTDRDGGFPNKNGTPPVGAIAPAPDFLLALLGYPANPAQGPYDVDVTTPMFYDFQTTGVAATMNYHTDFGTFTSVTGYREFDDDNNQEYGGAGNVTVGAATGPFFTSHRLQDHDQISEELRFASPSGPSFVDYVAGLYYLHQHYSLQNIEGGALFGNFSVTQYASQEDNAYAAFGQADFHLTSQLTLTAGGRYSYETKDFRNTPPGLSQTFSYNASWDDFSPKAVLSYKFTPQVMAYIQYARGYRSGGFNGRAGSETSAGPYQAEHVDSYEVGLKSEWLDRRLIFNADAFISKYDNIQEEVQRLSAATGLDETVVANAGAATYKGVELEGHAIVGGGLSADASLGYLDGHFDKFTANLNGDCPAGVVSFFCGINDYSKIPLPSVPHWSASVGLNYRHELPFAVFNGNISAAYTSAQYTSLTPINVVAPWFTLRPANTIVNTTLVLSTPDEKYRIALWIKNLTDEHVLYTKFTVGPLSSPESFEPPRTWGVSVGAKF